jgi:SAM-dependent methyltransferase
MSTPSASALTPPEQFAQRIAQALSQERCDRIVLANPAAALGDLQRIQARPVRLKGEPHLSVVFRHATKDITQNLPPDAAIADVMVRCGLTGFRNAHLFTTDGQEVQLAFSRKGKATLRVSGQVASLPKALAVSAEPSEQVPKQTQQAHNRSKQRWIAQDRPFLRALGVTDAQGQIVPAMSRKWKQINKFVEIFASAVSKSALAKQQALHVVDFGSGKGYLTFAVHDWLQHSQQMAAKVTGVELRDDLVALCQGVIQQLGIEGMYYEQGDVRHYHPDALDVVIALHACDVATDHAIELGIRAGAQIILCSPCCHKELRPQLLSPHPLRPILKHGIHQGQAAEMLTDGLRALLLEACGYDTQVFEFISLEHTSKNKMILAIKRDASQSAEPIWQEIADLKAFYGIQTQCLERLLATNRKP